MFMILTAGTLPHCSITSQTAEGRFRWPWED